MDTQDSLENEFFLHHKKEFLYAMNLGKNIVDHLESTIAPLTGKTFRLKAKHLDNLMDLFLELRYITSGEHEKAKHLIQIKREKGEADSTLDIKSFLNDQETLQLIEKVGEKSIRVLSLLPILFTDSLSNSAKIKTSEIECILLGEEKKAVVMTWTNAAKEEQKLLIKEYGMLFYYAIEMVKKNTEYLFDDFLIKKKINYIKLNTMIKQVMKSYADTKYQIIPSAYTTALRNSIRAQKNSSLFTNIS